MHVCAAACAGVSECAVYVDPSIHERTTHKAANPWYSWSEEAMSSVPENANEGCHVPCGSPLRLLESLDCVFVCVSGFPGVGV